MSKRLSPEKALELDRLSRILGAFAAWADPIMALPPEGETCSKTVARVVRTRSVSGLRMLLNDLIPMIQGATTGQRRTLDELLREKAGVSLSALLERQNARIQRLRQRGKLTSEEQYYLVREHIDLIEGDAEHTELVSELYGLLYQYEETAIKRTLCRDPDQAI